MIFWTLHGEDSGSGGGVSPIPQRPDVYIFGNDY